MADRITTEQRSNNMKAIRSISELENKVSKALWAKGVRFRRNVRSLYGTPDFAIKKHKTVVFIDSCFWHACPKHGNRPKTNSEYWNKKLNRNIERDIEVSDFYTSKNWKILRVWEHEFKEDFDAAVLKIENFITDSKSNNKL